MESGDHDRGVEEAEEEAADRAERPVQPVDAAGQLVGDLAGDGADDDEGQEPGDEQRDEWGEQEVGRALEDLVQPLLDQAQDPCDDQGGDDHRLVADLRDLQAEEVPHGGLVRVAPEGARLVGLGHRVGAEQGGRDHRRTHRGAEVHVPAEALGRREADQDRQRGEGRGGHQVDERVVVLQPGEHLHDGLRGEEALGLEDGVEGHQEAAGDQGGQDRDEDVGDHLDEAGEQVPALLGLFLGLVLGDLADPVVVDHVLEDLVDVAGADDDLEHAAGGEGALELLVVVQRLLVDLVRVGDHQSESRRAVGRCADVRRSADCLDDLGRHLGVIHD